MALASWNMPNMNLLDVPESEEGRARLEELAGQYRAAGNNAELGRVLLRLAQVCERVGQLSDSHENALSAIEVLRGTDDKKALAAALRAAANPMFGVDAAALLHEALGISRSEKDVEGQGWAIFGLSQIDSSYSLEEAISLFGRASCGNGVAACLECQALRSHDPWPLFIQAAEHYERAGEPEQALRAYVKAVTLDRRGRPPAQCENALRKSLRLARKPGDRATIYRHLVEIWKGDEEKVAHFRKLENDLGLPEF